MRVSDEENRVFIPTNWDNFSEWANLPEGTTNSIALGGFWVQKTDLVAVEKPKHLQSPYARRSLIVDALLDAGVWFVGNQMMKVKFAGDKADQFVVKSVCCWFLTG